jgi:hypothetical protein
VNANVQREGFFCGDGGGKPKFRLPYKYFKKKKREISSICKRIRGLVVSYVLSIKHWVVSGGSEQVDDVVSKLRLRPLLVPSESRSRRRDLSRKKRGEREIHPRCIMAHADSSTPHSLA